MKAKLTNSELTGLAEILDVYCNQLRLSTEVEDKLYLAIMENMRIGIEQKLVTRQPKYTMKFKPHEALCLWLNFNHRVTDSMDQAGNMLRLMCNKIHQQYSLPCNK